MKQHPLSLRLLTLTTAVLCFGLAPKAGAQIRLQQAVITPANGHAANGSQQGFFTLGQQVAGTASNNKGSVQFGYWTTPGFTAGIAPVAPLASALQISAWPNPAGAQMRFSVDLSEPTAVRVRLYDLDGRIVRTLADQQAGAGSLQIRFDASELPSGTYFVSVDIPGEVAEQKFTVQH